nr:unnamed protein product [Digitaria exilis]
MQQGSSSSCRTADAATWGSAQKRQRCQGSSSTSVEATVPWLQKIAPKVEPKEPPKSSNADENANKYKQFKQFDTIQNFSDHHFAKVPPTEPEPGQREFNMTGNFWRRIYQVLVSIQALILNEKPYYNEPGYEASANTPNGQRQALDYNDNTFLHSCRTMLYSLRRPPEHFADLVAGHFRVHGHTILAACKHYMEGNDVGSVVPEEEDESECKSSDVGASSSSSNEPKLGVVKAKPPTRRTTFNTNLKTLYEDLLMEFNVKGADTRKFLVEKLKKNEPAERNMEGCRS